MIKYINNIVIEGKHKKPILLDICYDASKTSQPKPIVIFCHGYKGFKNWGPWDTVANHFATRGLLFLKFNFSHNGGTIDQPIDFTDLEAFAQNNYCKELDDLSTIIDWIHNTTSIMDIKKDLSNITFIGHSRGGGICTIKAAEDQRVNKLITWASVSDYSNRFPKGDAFESWKKTGRYTVLNGRTKQQMPHDFQFYNNFKENEGRLNILKASSTLQIPQLVIHGTNDKTVDHSEAMALHQSNPSSELLLIPEANHVFGSKHPWNEHYLPKHLKKITDASIDFALL